MADHTILIRNPDVVRDIQKLAEQIGTDVDDAVAEAVRAQLRSEDTPTGEAMPKRDDRIRAALAAWDALPHRGTPLTDDDLYDEHGLPR